MHILKNLKNKQFRNNNKSKTFRTILIKRVDKIFLKIKKFQMKYNLDNFSRNFCSKSLKIKKIY